MRGRPTDLTTSLRDTCARAAVAIDKAFVKRRFEEHAQLAAGLVRSMNRLPLSVLEPCESALIDRVRNDGVEPYLTVLIDHGYRLGKSATKENDRRYAAIGRAVNGRMKKGHVPDSEAATLLRTMSHDRFRPYSANVGYAVLAVTYSPFGRAQFARLASPEHLLRLIELYRNCSERVSPTPTPTPRPGRPGPRDACDVLTHDMNAGTPEGEDHLSMSDLVGFVRSGVLKGSVACMAALANDDGARVDRLTECHRSEQSWRASASSIYASGAVSSIDDYRPHKNGSDSIKALLRGATEVGDPEYDETFGPGGIGAVETYHYKNGDEDITISHYSAQVTDASGNATEQSGTWIQTSGPDGTSSQLWVNEKGGGERLTYTSWESSDSKSSYYATFNENGTLKLEVYTDEDGTTTMNTYDKDGNLVRSKKYDPNQSTPLPDPTASPSPSPSPSPSTTPDSPDLDACQGILSLTLMGRTGAGRRNVSPWILPNPDSPDSVKDLCLKDYFGNTRRKVCPPSVIQCVDDTPIGQCGCNLVGPGGPPPGAAQYCQRIDCGPDQTCNPSTGACTGANGGFTPGLAIPHPGPVLGAGGGGPIRIGLPKNIRAMFPNQPGLWFPDPSSKRAVAIFGTRRPGADAVK